MKKLYGITVALITPISRDSYKIDHEKLARLVRFLVEKGVHCIYCCGTDSEMFHITIEERKQIAETVVKAAKGEVVVYVHCGAMMQDETLDLVRHAAETGADGVGVITPPYYPATARELETYYKTVSSSVDDDFPIYVYNIPQLAINDIKPDVLRNIVGECKNIVGIKYNYPDINQTFDYTNINDGRFSVLQGDDRVLPAWLALGCSGTVAGAANVFPEPLVASYTAYMDGDHQESLKQARIAAEYVDAMQNDNVAYFKAGLAIRGFDIGTMKKPLLELEKNEVENLREKLEAISQKHGITTKIFN